jgi:citrate lyase beta subunit
MADWYEDPSHPQTIRYNGDAVLVDKFMTQAKLPVISSNKISQYYHALLETAASWIQRFEILEHWTSSFDEINTTLYLVHRPKNTQPPLRLAITLSLVVERAAGVALVRSQLPTWCRVAERGENLEYLAAKPGMDGWRAIYPALERDR